MLLGIRFSDISLPVSNYALRIVHTSSYKEPILYLIYIVEKIFSHITSNEKVMFIHKYSVMNYMNGKSCELLQQICVFFLTTAPQTCVFLCFICIRLTKGIGDNNYVLFYEVKPRRHSFPFCV